MSLTVLPLFAFVLEIGPHLEGAVLGSFLIVTVGGYVGAWRPDGVAPKRSLGSLLFGDDDRDARRHDQDGGDAGARAADPD